MKWVSVMQELPHESLYVLVYTEIFGTYHIANFHPMFGWRNSSSYPIKSVTQWLDCPLPLDFPFTDEYDEEIGKKYGFRQPGMFG